MMTTEEVYVYVFTGMLEPKSSSAYLELNSTLQIHHVETGMQGDLKICIRKAVIEIQLATSTISTPISAVNLETLKNLIQNAVEAVINLYGFVHSISFDVYILKVKCRELKINYAFESKGEFNIVKTEAAGREEFGRLLTLFQEEQNTTLTEVFSDFHKAIKYPAMTAQFCYRAIEVIRRSYFENSSIEDEKLRRNNGWKSLRTDLGYKKSDFNQLNEYGVPNRHGTYPYITYQTRQNMLNFTRELINKFIKVKLESQIEPRS